MDDLNYRHDGNSGEPAARLAVQLNEVLPQTQCRRCGFDSCLPYAKAMAASNALPNRCPPGDIKGQAKLSALLGLPPMPLDSECGQPAARTIAVINLDLCIGCTKCMPDCPTDAIVGGPKLKHWVIVDLCTGCDLCIAPCPVDCISMVSAKSLGLSEWSLQHRQISEVRFEKKMLRKSPPALVTAKGTINQSNKLKVQSAIEQAREQAKLRLASAHSLTPIHLKPTTAANERQ